MSKINEYVTAINLAMGSGVTLQVISPSSSILASYLVFHHDRILLMRYAILKKDDICAYSGLSICTVQNSAHYGINGTHDHGYHDPLSI